MQSKKLLLYVVSTSILTGSSFAYADVPVTAPALPGMVTASVGTFYAPPAIGDYVFTNNFKRSTSSSGVPAFPFTTEPVTLQTDYDWGVMASLGYVFNNTPNAIELSYRGFNGTTNAKFHSDVGVIPTQIPFPSTTGISPFNLNFVTDRFKLKLHTVDLMASEALQIGSCARVRFLAGVSYMYIKATNRAVYVNTDIPSAPLSGLESRKFHKFDGWGPRFGVDAHYNLGCGFGLVAGGSVAFFFGKQKYSEDSFVPLPDPIGLTEVFGADHQNHHLATNLRGNLGLDYVYKIPCISCNSTVGLEVGYQADLYNDTITNLCTGAGFPIPGPTPIWYINTTTRGGGFSLDGFYLNLKATF